MPSTFHYNTLGANIALKNEGDTTSLGVPPFLIVRDFTRLQINHTLLNIKQIKNQTNI